MNVVRIRRGETYIMHLGTDRVKAARNSGRFDATSDFAVLREIDVVIIVGVVPLGVQAYAFSVPIMRSG